MLVLLFQMVKKNTFQCCQPCNYCFY